MITRRPHRSAMIYTASVIATIVLGLFSPMPIRLFSASVCLMMSTVVWYFTGQQREVFASAVATSVFVLTIVSSWIWGGTLSVASYQDVHHVVSQLREVEFEVEKYRKEKGTLPDSLTGVPSLAQEDNWNVRGPWNRLPEYRVINDTFELKSLGRDGTSGGEGHDADFLWRGESASNIYQRIGATWIPLWQYVFETPSTNALVLPLLWLALTAQHVIRWEEGDSAGVKRPILSGFAFVAALTAVSTFLGMFHVAAVQSGH